MSSHPWPWTFPSNTFSNQSAMGFHCFCVGFLLDLFPPQAAESVSSPCNVSDLSMPCKVTWMWNGLWMFFLSIDMAFYVWFYDFLGCVSFLYVGYSIYKCHRGFVEMYGKLMCFLWDMLRTDTWTTFSSWSKTSSVSTASFWWKSSCLSGIYLYYLYMSWANYINLTLSLPQMMIYQGKSPWNALLIQGYIGPIDMCCMNFGQDFIYQLYLWRLRSHFCTACWRSSRIVYM